MARMVVIYRTPTDPAAFDQHYAEIHVPLVKKLPGIEKFEFSKGPVVMPMGGAPVHAVATLYFADMAALGAAMESPAGKAAAADAQVVATGGAEIFVFDPQEL